VEQRIQFCSTREGVRIAYGILGEGPPLVTTPSSWESLGFVLQQNVGGRFYQALAQHLTVVRYERGGVGLSDRRRSEFTSQADVADLEAVVDSLGFERFALMGSFHLGPAAIAFTARHPQRVSHLVLYGTYPCGSELTRDDVKTSLTSMIRSHWGIASRTLADLTAPGVAPEFLEGIAQDERQSAAGETVARLIELAYRTDVTELLPAVTAPTLVLHRRGDRVVPFRLGCELASILPNARLVTLDGDIHWPWFGDTGAVLKSILEFLGADAPGPAEVARTGQGALTILFTDMEGSTTLTQRLGDAKAQEALRTHNSIIRDALRTHGGSETKHTGDGIMAAFPSASRALECAVAIQRSLASHNENLLRQAQDARDTQAEPVEARPALVRVRIGLNAGEPIAEDDDLFGTAVQLAARVCAHARPGQILASDVVRQLAAGKGLLFADRGDVTLRGFENPVRLYEVAWRT
jgi:class 3 adenylate cyclase/pimeloyl-ACP methyl ester carboxylesterase